MCFVRVSCGRQVGAFGHCAGNELKQHHLPSRAQGLIARGARLDVSHGARGKQDPTPEDGRFLPSYPVAARRPLHSATPAKEAAEPPASAWKG